MSRLRTVTSGALAAIVVLAVATSAAAHWTAGGGGSGQASTSTLQPLVATAGTATVALHPGGTADAVLVVTNPNPVAVSITAIAPGAGGVVTSGGSGGCSEPAVALAAPDASSLAALDPIEPGGPVTIALPGAVSMGESSPSGCQGASFSIPVVVDVGFRSWTASGPGAAGATAAQLSAPIAVAVSAVDDQSLRVSWSAPAGPAPTGYLVHRVGGTGPVCSVVAGSELACTDSGLAPATTYAYTVQATLHSWIGPAGTPVSGTTEASSGAPAVSIAYPTASTGGAAWQSGCSPMGVCGAASADGNRTLTAVEVSIVSASGSWWDGSSFAAPSEQGHTAVIGSGTWSYAMPAPPVGTYTLTVRATDDRGRTTEAARTFTVDGPTLVSLEMRDANGNGRVDRVVATFDRPLSPSSTTAPWTLTNVPSGGTLTSVSTSGSVATLVLAEGAGLRDTAVGSFRVALSAAAGGIRDAAGNPASFGARAPLDKAGPVVVSVADQAGAVKGTAAGLAQQGDTVDFTFSEPVQAPASTTNAVLSWTSNSVSALLVPGVVDGRMELGAHYFDKTGNQTITFNGSSLSRLAGERTIRLTLGAPSASGNAAAGAPESGGVVTLSPSSSVVDPFGNPAVGAFSSSPDVIRFF